MAPIRIPPAEARVHWDRTARRPAVVRWPGHRLQVTDLDAVRDERSAYPADRGPRVTYHLRGADGSRATLVFDGRRRRWFVEVLDRAA